MATESDKFVIIRVLETTRKRLKVKAAREEKSVYELVDELSKDKRDSYADIVK